MHLHRSDFPFMATVGVAFHAKYLGVQLGPAALEVFWDEAVGKYSSVCRRWSQGPWGLMLGADVYNTYCHSTLSFLAQFPSPGALVLKAERKALAMFTPGPGNWIRKEEIFQLHLLQV